MRVISTRAHAIIDYIFGIVLIIAPFVLGFADGGAAQWSPIIVGLAVIGMSLITDYELSVAKIVPMPAHLGVDIVAGIILAASPWLFGFADRIFWPHVIFGLLEIGTAMMTRTAPADSLHRA